MAPQQHRVRQHLPSPPVSFTTRKHKILEQLSVPDAEYTDASPKGSVDVGIRELIDELNALDGFVTTSSCAGRVSVFLEGRRAAVVPASASTGTAAFGEPHSQSATQSDDNSSTIATIAGPGGKGGGGTWLFVSHDPVPESNDGDEKLLHLLGLVGEKEATAQSVAGESGSAQPGRRRKRLIHFKFEPMILHVLTASLAHAQLLLKCAFAAGFRESGALNLLPTITATELQDDSSSPVTPMVGVRTMGLALESLIGYVDDSDDARHCTVSVDYLRDLMQIANERFTENAARIARFRAALQDALAGPPPKLGEGGVEWEDAAARRERKRAEGLRRKEELLAARQKTQTHSQSQTESREPPSEDPVGLPEYELHGLM
ncbi:tRNA wybutosine-synthesizing protein 4 [Colletotrichum spaethianum]|uniref:tRNA(Phe) 7-[(3-amino-3-carboxypropyl)-4-demethylwyosine(37)-N(4)]-methyltransferase n=1 Tax=Colletotrichum spaethianum TaxID=700344 RepID=A0AA37L9M0_9PEZI|nr:tRNA wybutosine-synthesizing protein 4 [Colletotrichum spaethianum]GKT42585.1 tRNA wybutosine-synthesizing protein 4 [Colletotrichum spaethianum]